MIASLFPRMSVKDNKDIQEEKVSCHMENEVGTFSKPEL